VLPPRTDDAAPDVPDEVSEDTSMLWTEAACELARHQDEEMGPQIETLFAHDLLDPLVFGGRVTYRQIMAGNAPDWAEFEPASFDVVDYYEHWYQRSQRQNDGASEQPQKSLDEREREWVRGRKASSGGHYEEGTFVKDTPDVGRNDPCPCGSGVKYKYRCG
jgi:hypothetical protein